MTQILGPCGRSLTNRQNLTIEEISFIRGYLQGIGVSILVERYLNERSDRRLAQRLLRKWRGLLQSLSSQPEAAAAVRVLNRSVRRRTQNGRGKPTFEEFWQQIGGDFYSENELIAMYTEAFPGEESKGDPAQEDLIQEKLNALDLLIPIINKDVSKSDKLVIWLYPTHAVSLMRAGIETIEDLVKIVSTNKTWYRQFASIGPLAALRIKKWLMQNSFLADSADISFHELLMQHFDYYFGFCYQLSVTNSTDDNYHCYDQAVLKKTQIWLEGCGLTDRSKRLYVLALLKWVYWASVVKRIPVFETSVTQLEFDEFYKSLIDGTVNAKALCVSSATGIAKRCAAIWNFMYRNGYVDNKLKVRLDLQSCLPRSKKILKLSFDELLLLIGCLRKLNDQQLRSRFVVIIVCTVYLKLRPSEIARLKNSEFLSRLMGISDHSIKGQTSDVFVFSHCGLVVDTSAVFHCFRKLKGIFEAYLQVSQITEKSVLLSASLGELRVSIFKEYDEESYQQLFGLFLTLL